MKLLALILSCLSTAAYAQTIPPLRVYDAGTVKPLRFRLNFIGATIADDSANKRTNVTISAPSSLSGTITGTYTLAGTPTYSLSQSLSIGTGQTAYMTLASTTAAGAGAQQYSPMLQLSGRGWKTDATAASQAVDYAWQVIPVQGTANPTGKLKLWSRVNAGSWAEALSITEGDGPGVTALISQGIMGIRLWAGGNEVAIRNNGNTTFAFTTSAITSNYSASLVGFDNLGATTVQIGTLTAKPTCDSSKRGYIYIERGAGGSTDTLYACMKAVADTYSWVSIVTGG